MDFDEEPPVERAPKKRFRKNKLKLVFDPNERKKFLLGFRKRKQERKEKYIEKLEKDLAQEKKRIRQQTQRKAKKSSSHSVLPEVQNLIDTMPEKEETYDLGNTLVSITSLDDEMYRNLPTIKEEDEEDMSEEEEGPSSSSSKDRMRKWSKKSGLNLLDEVEVDSEGEPDELKRELKTDPFFNPINDDELSRSDSDEEDDEEVNYDPLAMLRKNTESASDPSKLLSKSKLEREANRVLQGSEIFKKIIKLKQKRSKKFKMFRLQPSAEEPGEGSGKKEIGKAKGKGKKLMKGLKRGKSRKRK